MQQSYNWVTAVDDVCLENMPSTGVGCESLSYAFDEDPAAAARDTARLALKSTSTADDDDDDAGLPSWPMV